MARTWNRDVYDVGNFLICVIKGSNPPRNDTADDITTFTADRAGSGAKIHYHAKGDVKLTGISMKDGGAIPTELEVKNPNPQLLTLIDKGPIRTEWSL